MFDRFTDRARKVMALAAQEAQRFNHQFVGTEHILLGLVKEGTGVGANVVKNLGVDLRNVRLELEMLVKSGPEKTAMGKLLQTRKAKKAIEYAIEEARNLSHKYVGTEHLLLGLLREREGVAAQVLMNVGLKVEEVREEVRKLLGLGMETEQPPLQPDLEQWASALLEEVLAEAGPRPYEELMGRLERPVLAAALRRFGGNQAHVAEALHLHRSTLRKKLRLYGLIGEGT